MTIIVKKILQTVTNDRYLIECSAIELEYLRLCLRGFENKQEAGPNGIEFAGKCATIINNALVANGD